MDRKAWDRLVSWSGLIVAVVLILVGSMAIYGGRFGQDNVKDRLAPEMVSFPPLSGMTADEQQKVGEFAGQQVTTGPQAEAFARYIQGHLAEVNGGQTYSQTSAAARDENTPPKEAADLAIKADILFKGETLRAILLNAYGWWTVATIALWAGVVMIVAGIAMLVLAILGFRHMGRNRTEVTVVKDDRVPATV